MLKIILYTILAICIPCASGANIFSCKDLLKSYELSANIRDLALKEQTENPFQPTATGYKRIQYVLLGPDSVIIRKSVDEIPQAFLSLLYDSNGRVRWFRHPYFRHIIIDDMSWQRGYHIFEENEAGGEHLFHGGSKVPHATVEADGYMMGQLSASRSTFLSTGDGHDVSIKMPMNDWKRGVNKWDTRKTVKDSIEQSRVIKEVDSRIGSDSELKMLLDIVSVADKATGFGFVIRDLSLLQNDFNMVPGFSKKKYLTRYARVAGISRRQAMIDFAKLYGRSLAKVLLRYGLIIQYPHDQNYLLAFHHDFLEPHVYWRDVSDTGSVPALQNAIGVRSDVREVENKIHLPFEQNQLIFKDYSGRSRHLIVSVARNEMIRYIYQTLNKPYTQQDLTEEKLNNFLFSPEGLSALSVWHASLSQI